MGRRRELLGEAERSRLVEAIRAGAYAWVAAELVGVGRREFDDWRARGEAGERPYAELMAVVQQAEAEARTAAERRVLEDDPLSWLRLGPGRERPSEPGWAAPQRPLAVVAEQDDVWWQELEAALAAVEGPGVVGDE